MKTICKKTILSKSRPVLHTFKLTVTIKNKIKFDIYYRRELSYTDSYISSCLELIDMNKDIDYYLKELNKLVNFPTGNYLTEDSILNNITDKIERNKVFKLVYCIKSIVINTINGTSASS